MGMEGVKMEARNFLEIAEIARQRGAKINVVGAAAQAILESGWGESWLAKEANNFFGIKKGSGWNGKTVHKETSEYTPDEVHYTTVAEWRKYNHSMESFMDYAALLERPRYAKVIEAVEEGLPVREYIQRIKDAGYATDPHYVDKIMRIIEAHDMELRYKAILERSLGRAINNFNIVDSDGTITIHYKGQHLATFRDDNKQIRFDFVCEFLQGLARDALEEKVRWQ